jgi:hypothetical protein
MATVDAPVDAGDALPMLPPDATPTAPSIAEQRRQHAADNPPPADDSLPMQAPPPKPSILNSNWSQIGKTLWDEGSRWAGLGTRAAMEGLSSVGTGPADIAMLPSRLVESAFNIPSRAPSAMNQQAINATGLPTPQTPTERNVSTFVAGAAPAVASLGMSGAPTIANATRMALQGGAGALAGQTVAESDLVPSWLKPAAATTAGMLAGKAADVGWGAGGRLSNAATGATSDAYQAFQRLGIDPRLVGTVGAGEAGHSAEAAFSRVPFASSVIRPVQERTVGQFGDAVDRTAAQLDPTGQATTARTTGINLQAAARDWRDNVFPAQQAQAWGPVDQGLAGTSVTPTGYRAALDSVTKQLNLPETQKALTPGLATQLSDALTKDVGSGAMTWQQASQLRTLLGKTMGVPEISQSVGADALKRAYAGIASDMRDTATAHGQANQFDAANQLSTDGHAFINGPLSNVISTNNPAQERITPEQATNNALNGGDTTMQAMRARLPGATDLLAAYKLQQMATAKPSVASAYDDTSTGTFLSNVNRMRQQTPGGYGALYNTPAVQQQLDDLATVAQRLRATEKHLNTSGTAESLSWLEYIRGIAEAATELKPGKTFGSMVIPPAVGLGGGRLMTSPTLARIAAARPAGPPPIPPSVGGLLGAAPQLVGQYGGQ